LSIIHFKPFPSTDKWKTKKTFFYCFFSLLVENMSGPVKGVARLLVPAGGAKPSPAIGQALGPLGVNMMEFCKVSVPILDL